MNSRRSFSYPKARKLRLLAPVALLAAAAPSQGQVADFWQDVERTSTAAAARTAGDPTGIDRDGVTALRAIHEYEITGSRNLARRSLSAAEAAIRRNEEAASAQFALGVALARGPDVRRRIFKGPHEYFVDHESNAYNGAVRAFRAALALDSAEIGAAVELGELYIGAGDQSGLRSLVAPLSVSESGRARAALARVLERLGRQKEALEWTDSAVAAGGADAEAMHIRAILHFRSRQESEGAEAYFEAATRLEWPTALRIRRELAPIMSSAQAAEWDKLQRGRHAAWLHQFWSLKAATAGVAIEERIARHYQRLIAAREMYPMSTGVDSDAIRRAGEDPRRYGLSLEGLLLVRHGDPDRLGAVSCQDSLRYADGLRNALLEFGEYVPGGLRVPPEEVESLLEQIPPDLRLPCPVQAMRRRNLQSLPAWQRNLQLADLRSRTIRAVQQLASGESYHPPFERPLSFAWELFTFRGADGSTEVTAAIALPWQSARVLAPDGRQFSARLSATIMSGTTVVRSDSTVRASLIDPASRSTALLHTTVVDVPIGEVEYRLYLADTSGLRAGAVARGTTNMPDFTGADPAISDVVLAPEGTAATWRRGDVVISIAPKLATPATTPLTLYYEVYGIAVGRSIRTDIVITPLRFGVAEALRRFLGRESEVVGITFEEVVSDLHPKFGVQQVRTIGTSGLAPGEYRIDVNVTDPASGRQVRQSRTFQLLAPVSR